MSRMAVQNQAVCARCGEHHPVVCPRCYDVHERETPDGPEPVLCPHCQRRHQILTDRDDPTMLIRLAPGQSCCLRQIDRAHVCGKPTRPPEFRVFCRSDQEAVEEALSEIPDRYVELYLALEGIRSGDLGAIHANGFESRLPIAAHISSLMQEFVGLHPQAQQNHLGSERRLGVIVSWEDALREHLGFARRPVRRMRPVTPKEQGWMREAQRQALRTYDTPRGSVSEAIAVAYYQIAVERVMVLRGVEQAAVEGQAGPTLASSCAFLRVHLGQLLDYSADAGNEILALRERALRVLGLSSRDEFEPMPDAECPHCGLKMLYRRVGEDRVQCGSGRGCPDLTMRQYRMRTWREYGFASQTTS